jgi:hypothetical protein
LPKVTLLQAFYMGRSERRLIEQIDYNMLGRRISRSGCLRTEVDLLI